MIRAAPLLLLLLPLGACIPETKDFELIPEVVGASGEASAESITVRMTIDWVNGESAPETTVVISPNVALEDDDTQDVLGRVQVDRLGEFDNVLGAGESASVDYEGTQDPPIPQSGGPDPAVVCDGRTVHIQIQYSTHGSLADAPQAAISNPFTFVCE